MTAYNPDPVAIETSIRSVLQQTWKNLELLIVDDASAAQYTPEIANLAELDPRIRVIHLPENGGTYNARNAGWAEAKGEFITGQDAEVASIKSIIAGEQTQTVFKDTRTLATQTVDMVEAVVEGQEVPVNDTESYDNGVKVVPSFLLEPVSVDADNYHEALIESGYYEESELE